MEMFNTRDSEIRFFIFLAISLCLILIASFIFAPKSSQNSNSLVLEEVAPGSFPEVAIQARAAYVYDARTQTVLFAKSENLRLPLASLTKVMAALVATELNTDGRNVVVTREALMMHGDNGLRAGERWRIKDLLDFSLISSSNDGMRAVALTLGSLGTSHSSSDESVSNFVNEMNLKAATLNLKDTYFWNETGLDESEAKGGAYGTAKDMTVLMNYIIANHPEILEATKQSFTVISSIDNFQHEVRNTNALASSIPGLSASKTGFTNNAGGNLTLVFDPELGRPIIVTILGSTERGRFEDAGKLVKATLDYLRAEI
jgi:serine-type D-Ala-D-Ala carboxypeptidase (penicillin-binding protein 5/6)